MSPSGVMFNPKYSKIADPLGVTNTVIGDPTGRFRKERAKNEAAARGPYIPPAPAYLPSDYVAQAGSAQIGIDSKSTTTARRASLLYGTPKLNTLSYG